MLRPQDTATRAPLNGLWRFPLDAGAGRAARSGGSPDRSQRRAGHGRPGELQRPARRRRRARPRRRGLVPDHRPGAPRLGRRAHRAALRVGDAPRDRLGRRRRGRPARGRLHAVRGRRHRARHAPARRSRITVAVDNRLSFQTIPPGVVEDTPAGPPPAVLARLLQLRRPAPLGLAVRTPPARIDGRHGRHRPRRRRRHRSTTASRPPTATASRSGSCCATPRARRSRRRPARRAADRRRRAPLGARRRLPLRPRGPAASTRRARSSTATTRASASAPSRSGAPSSSSTASPFYFTGFGMHEDHAAHRQGPQPRLPGARLRAARVDRRQLVPHLALPLLRGRPRPRRPPRHRRHRRDRGRRPEHGPRRRHLRRAGLHDLLPGDDQRRDPARSTPRRSASSSPATRTTRASCCGRSPTSRSRTPRARRSTSGRCSTLTRELDPTRPVGLRQRHARAARQVPGLRSSPTCSCSTATTAGTSTPATSPAPSGAGRRSCAAGPPRASRSSSPSTAPTRCPGCTPSTPQPWTEEYQVDVPRR